MLAYEPSDDGIDDISFEEDVTRPTLSFGLGTSAQKKKPFDAKKKLFTPLKESLSVQRNVVKDKGLLKRRQTEPERDPYNFSLEDPALSRDKGKFDFDVFEKGRIESKSSKVDRVLRSSYLGTASSTSSKPSTQSLYRKDPLKRDATVCARTHREETLDDFLNEDDSARSEESKTVKTQLPQKTQPAQKTSVGSTAKSSLSTTKPVSSSQRTKMVSSVTAIPTGQDSSTSSPLGHVTFDDEQSKREHSDPDNVFENEPSIPETEDSPKVQFWSTVSKECKQPTGSSTRNESHDIGIEAESSHDEDESAPVEGENSKTAPFGKVAVFQADLLPSFPPTDGKPSSQHTNDAARGTGTTVNSTKLRPSLEHGTTSAESNDSDDAAAPFGKVASFKPELLPSCHTEDTLPEEIAERLGESALDVPATDVLKKHKTTNHSAVSRVLTDRSDHARLAHEDGVAFSIRSANSSQYGHRDSTHNDDQERVGNSSMMSQTYLDDFDSDSDGDGGKENAFDDTRHVPKRSHQRSPVLNCVLPANDPVPVTKHAALPVSARSTARSTARSIARSTARQAVAYEATPRERRRTVDIGIQAAVPVDAGVQCDDLLPGATETPHMSQGTAPPFGSTYGSFPAAHATTASAPFFHYPPNMMFPPPMMYPYNPMCMMPPPPTAAWGHAMPGAYPPDPQHFLRSQMFRNAVMEPLVFPTTSLSAAAPQSSGERTDGDAGDASVPLGHAERESVPEMSVPIGKGRWGSTITSIGMVDNVFREQLLQLRMHAERNRARLESLMDRELAEKNMWASRKTQINARKDINNVPTDTSMPSAGSVSA